MIRRWLASWLRMLATWLDRHGAEEATEPPEWSKRDGWTQQRDVIAAYVAPAGRDLGIVLAPTGQFAWASDQDEWRAPSRAHNPQGYL